MQLLTSTATYKEGYKPKDLYFVVEGTKSKSSKSIFR
jgi:hypothetical protein